MNGLSWVLPHSPWNSQLSVSWCFELLIHSTNSTSLQITHFNSHGPFLSSQSWFQTRSAENPNQFLWEKSSRYPQTNPLTIISMSSWHHIPMISPWCPHDLTMISLISYPSFSTFPPPTSPINRTPRHIMLRIGFVPLRHLRFEVRGEGPVEPQIFRHPRGDVSRRMVMIFRGNFRTLKWRQTLLNHFLRFFWWKNWNLALKFMLCIYYMLGISN